VTYASASALGYVQNDNKVPGSNGGIGFGPGGLALTSAMIACASSAASSRLNSELDFP
jgi:hypothetical protein